MRESRPHDKERTANDRPDHRDPAAAEHDALPPDPNPEHPEHYPTEARRWFKRLKSGEWDWYDLGAREIGIVVWYYPHLAGSQGGDPS